MTLTVFLLALGLTARLSRLLTVDYLTRHIRAFVIGRLGPDHDLAYGIACPWCSSIWIAGAVFPVAYFYGEHAGFLIPAAALSASYLYGIVATNLDGPGDDE